MGFFKRIGRADRLPNPVVRGYSVFHWSRWRGIKTYLEWMETSGSFQTVARPLEFLWSFR